MASKTSGHDKEFIKFEARSVLRFSGNVVESAEVQGGMVVGSVLRKSTSELDWVGIPPHIAFANLPTFDKNGTLDLRPNPGLIMQGGAVEEFIKSYGLLYLRDLPVDARDLYAEPKNYPPDLRFTEQLSQFSSDQRLLRQAWSDDLSFVDIEQNILQGLQVSMRGRGVFDVLTADLWQFISLLFVLDHSASKIGVCENPSCVAPYFIVDRRTQKFCKSPDCTAYAARMYTQRWWDSGGKDQRAKARSRKKKDR